MSIEVWKRLSSLVPPLAPGLAELCPLRDFQPYASVVPFLYRRFLLHGTPSGTQFCPALTLVRHYLSLSRRPHGFRRGPG
jgi:hypothetical protein